MGKRKDKKGLSKSESKSDRVTNSLHFIMLVIINVIRLIIVFILPVVGFLTTIRIGVLLLEDDKVNFVLLSIFILVPATMALATKEISNLYKKNKEKEKEEKLKEIATSFLRAATLWVILTVPIIIVDTMIRVQEAVQKNFMIDINNVIGFILAIWIILSYFVFLYIISITWRLLKLIGFDGWRLFGLEELKRKK